MASGDNGMAHKVILLVEDNPDDEALTLRALRKHNVTNQVVVARDGAEAIDWLFGTGQHADRDMEIVPQVILLDLKLPKVDGLEVLRRVRSDDRTHLLPIVILTSSKEEEDILNGYRLGANSYVRKPVDFVEFTDAVRQLGLFWLLLNQPPTRPGP
jgi:two-component system, response regulator